jgi:hypothetical protein
LTQRRAGKTNDKHQETTPVEVVRNDASHRIAKKPSPEPEPVAKDEPRKGGDEGDQQDEQIKQLKELVVNFCSVCVTMNVLVAVFVLPD